MKCLICNKKLKQISFAHLRIHKITAAEYKLKFNCNKLIDESVSKKLSKATSGKNNPMYGRENKFSLGRKSTEETKHKISKTRIERGVAKGSNNPMYGKKHSAETIAKISATRSKSIAEGKHNKSSHKHGYYFSNRLNKKIWYDSSYELKALLILEEDPLVANFGRSKLVIPYVYKGTSHRTIPDFLVEYRNGKKKVIEVKPQRKLEQIEQERIKIKTITIYCRENNLDYATWTELSLGI